MKISFAPVIAATAFAATAALANTPGAALVQRPALAGVPSASAMVTLIDSDDDDAESGWFKSLGQSDGDDCDDDADEGGCTSAVGANPAPAGTTAPPRNGLFTDGTAPAAKTN